MFYAAGVFTDKNPWWPVMPDTSRDTCSASVFVLRQGEPVADVALYAPTEDAWAHDQAGNEPRSEPLRRHPRARLARGSSRRFSTPGHASI